jgi:hypothetical protein
MNQPGRFMPASKPLALPTSSSEGGPSLVQLIDGASPQVAASTAVALVTGGSGCSGPNCPSFVDARGGLKVGNCSGSCPGNCGVPTHATRESQSAGFAHHAKMLAPCSAGGPGLHRSALTGISGSGSIAGRTAPGGVEAEHRELQATMGSVGCKQTYASSSALASQLLQAAQRGLNDPTVSAENKVIMKAEVAALTTRISAASPSLGDLLRRADDRARALQALPTAPETRVLPGTTAGM